MFQFTSVEREKSEKHNDIYFMAFALKGTVLKIVKEKVISTSGRGHYVAGMLLSGRWQLSFIAAPQSVFDQPTHVQSWPASTSTGTLNGTTNCTHIIVFVSNLA